MVAWPRRWGPWGSDRARPYSAWPIPPRCSWTRCQPRGTREPKIGSSRWLWLVYCNIYICHKYVHTYIYISIYLYIRSILYIYIYITGYKPLARWLGSSVAIGSSRRQDLRCANSINDFPGRKKTIGHGERWIGLRENLQENPMILMGK